MNRTNTPLAAYLRTIDGFIYRSRPKNLHSDSATRRCILTRDDGSTYTAHTSSVPPITQSFYLEMPLHEFIPYNDTDFARLHRRQKSLQQGTWVRSKRGLYSGDVGVIVEVVSKPGKLDECSILFVPRFLIPESSGRKRKRSTRSEPRLLDINGAEFDALNDMSPITVFCDEPDCTAGLYCPHIPFSDRKSRWNGQNFEGALSVVKLSVSAVELATTIPNTTASLFRRSEHSFFDMFYPHYTMPPSADWVFTVGEAVVIVNPRFPQEDAERFVGAHFGMTGMVEAVDDFYCEVAVSQEYGVPQTLRLMKNTILKKITIGDTVEIASEGMTLIKTVAAAEERVSLRGQVGSVIELLDNRTVAKVVLGQFDVVSFFFLALFPAQVDCRLIGP